MNYDLVFEGGGAKGMVFVGAMQEYERRGHSFERLLGTSAGAITATLLAAGYSAAEMLATLSEQENDQPVFASFMGRPADFDNEAVRTSATLALLHSINLPMVWDAIEDKADEWLARALMRNACNLFSLIERGGWYSADNFVTWLERKLAEGEFQGNPRNFSKMTLSEFHAATGGRDLSLVASDTSEGRLLVLNHNTAPDLPVVWAVRMSMSIPMVWPEVEWQAGWGSYRGKTITGNLVVDGGLLSNFPIELFISDESQVVQVMGERKAGNRVLGLLIDEMAEVPGAPPAPDAPANGEFSVGQLRFIQRLNRLVNTATRAHDKMVIEAYNQLVVRLPAKGYGTTEFGMSEARRKALVAAGNQAMKSYLDLRDLLSFGVQQAVTSFQINLAEHADRVANRILD